MSQFFIELTNEIAVITLKKIPNNIYYISQIFKIISDKNIKIYMISKTSVYKDNINIIFSVSEDDITLFLEVLENFKKIIPDMATEITSNFSKATMTGIYLLDKCTVLSDFFKAASEVNTIFLIVTTSEHEISVLLDSDNATAFYKKIEEKYKK